MSSDVSWKRKIELWFWAQTLTPVVIAVILAPFVEFNEKAVRLLAIGSLTGLLGALLTRWRLR